MEPVLQRLGDVTIQRLEKPKEPKVGPQNDSGALEKTKEVKEASSSCSEEDSEDEFPLPTLKRSLPDSQISLKKFKRDSGDLTLEAKKCDDINREIASLNNFSDTDNSEFEDESEIESEGELNELLNTSGDKPIIGKDDISEDEGSSSFLVTDKLVEGEAYSEEAPIAPKQEPDEDYEYDIKEKLKEMGEISFETVKKGEKPKKAEVSTENEVVVTPAKKPGTSEEDKSGLQKGLNMRRNIREVMDETKLDEATLAAQRQEAERVRRVVEQQKILREYQRQANQEKTQQKVLSLLQGNSFSKAGQSSSTRIGNTVLVKLPNGQTKPMTKLSKRPYDLMKLPKGPPPQVPQPPMSPMAAAKHPRSLLVPKKPGTHLTPSVSIAPVNKKAQLPPIIPKQEQFSESDSDAEDNKPPIMKPKAKDTPVTTIDISSDDDCIVVSEPEGDADDTEDDPSNSGMHTNDEFNVPDEQGRILVNVGHPDNEPDVFVAPQIARIIKPHQVGGVRFLYDNVVESTSRFEGSSGFGCILAHSMGLGKTLQIVCFSDVFLRHTPAKTILCIMPINTLQNWMAEYNMWLPTEENAPASPLNAHGEVRPRNFNLHVLNDSHKTLTARAKVINAWRSAGGVLLIGYEQFRLLSLRKFPKSRKKAHLLDNQDDNKNKVLFDQVHEALIKPGPDLVICDEGHRIKNSHASISQALKQMSTKRRVVLTGYPLQNNLMEYWCMVDFVRPNYLGSKTEFCNMFERPIMNGQCIDSTEADIKLMRYRAHVLHSLLLGFVQRRSHTVLQTSLPQKEEYVLLVRMTPFQRKLYETFMNEVVRSQAVPNPLKAFAVCCKIWNHPDVLYNFLKKRAGGEAVDIDLEEVAGATPVITGTPTQTPVKEAKPKRTPSPRKKATPKAKNVKPAASVTPYNSTSDPTASSQTSQPPTQLLGIPVSSAAPTSFRNTISSQKTPTEPGQSTSFTGNSSYQQNQSFQSSNSNSSYFEHNFDQNAQFPTNFGSSTPKQTNFQQTYPPDNATPSQSTNFNESSSNFSLQADSPQSFLNLDNQSTVQGNATISSLANLPSGISLTPLKPRESALAQLNSSQISLTPMSSSQGTSTYQQLNNSQISLTPMNTGHSSSSFAHLNSNQITLTPARESPRETTMNQINSGQISLTPLGGSSQNMPPPSNYSQFGSHQYNSNSQYSANQEGFNQQPEQRPVNFKPGLPGGAPHSATYAPGSVANPNYNQQNEQGNQQNPNFNQQNNAFNQQNPGFNQENLPFNNATNQQNPGFQQANQQNPGFNQQNANFNQQNVGLNQTQPGNQHYNQSTTNFNQQSLQNQSYNQSQQNFNYNQTTGNQQNPGYTQQQNSTVVSHQATQRSISYNQPSAQPVANPLDLNYTQTSQSVNQYNSPTTNRSQQNQNFNQTNYNRQVSDYDQQTTNFNQQFSNTQQNTNFNSATNQQFPTTPTQNYNQQNNENSTLTSSSQNREFNNQQNQPNRHTFSQSNNYPEISFTENSSTQQNFNNPRQNYSQQSQTQFGRNSQPQSATNTQPNQFNQQNYTQSSSFNQQENFNYNQSQQGFESNQNFQQTTSQGNFEQNNFQQASNYWQQQQTSGTQEGNFSSPQDNNYYNPPSNSQQINFSAGNSNQNWLKKEDSKSNVSNQIMSSIKNESSNDSKPKINIISDIKLPPAFSSSSGSEKKINIISDIKLEPKMEEVDDKFDVKKEINKLKNEFKNELKIENDQKPLPPPSISPLPKLGSLMSGKNDFKMENEPKPLPPPSISPLPKLSSLMPSKDSKEDSGIPYDWAIELLKDYVPGRIENSAKMEILFCIIKESIALGDRLLVFSQSLITLDLIEHFLQMNIVPGDTINWAKNVSYYRLDGSTTALEREKLINEFNSNPKIHLFLVSTRAGSLGINLVGANRVVVLDASWNPCHDTQAVCRVYRYGQRKPCFVYRLVVDNCLEKKIYDRQVNKQGMSDRIVDECNPDAHLTMKDVSTLCWDDKKDEGEEKDWSHVKDNYIDVVLQKVLDKHGRMLNKEPFQHESLLVDRKEKQLSSQEKRLAKKGYEREKQAARQPAYSMASMGRGGHRPVASVRPMQQGERPSRWIPAEHWQRQGMTAQEMTLPLDVVIPTNQPEKGNIVLKAGQKVLVLKSPKGVYMQLESGKIVAIKTAIKVKGKADDNSGDPTKMNKPMIPPMPQLPPTMKVNPSLSVIPPHMQHQQKKIVKPFQPGVAKFNVKSIRQAVPNLVSRIQSVSKKVQMAKTKPYNLGSEIAKSLKENTDSVRGSSSEDEQHSIVAPVDKMDKPKPHVERLNGPEEIQRRISMLKNKQISIQRVSSQTPKSTVSSGVPQEDKKKQTSSSALEQLEQTTSSVINENAPFQDTLDSITSNYKNDMGSIDDHLEHLQDEVEPSEEEEEEEDPGLMEDKESQQEVDTEAETHEISDHSDEVTYVSEQPPTSSHYPAQSQASTEQSKPEGTQDYSYNNYYNYPPYPGHPPPPQGYAYPPQHPPPYDMGYHQQPQYTYGYQGYPPPQPYPPPPPQPGYDYNAPPPPPQPIYGGYHQPYPQQYPPPPQGMYPPPPPAGAPYPDYQYPSNAPPPQQPYYPNT
ncbi:uncharacterized protein LOC109597651 isoform X3 [Aethina tumida]|uniref:uncharacterized protein LOC109597651 isoform X3 n=1 Tax=Aethina tumida TaxID=116153 RepID=UPI0021481931|nr:uncharacterized protein LOC109597651 isoform X3 [Aethina tumida]